MVWFTTAQGDNIDDTLERVAHQALTEFCERHLPVLSDTAIALLPIRNEGNVVWSERVAAVGNPEFLTHHAGWAFTTCYAQHVSSLLQEVTVTGAHLRLRLEECVGQVKAKNRIIKDIQKGNWELLQKNSHLKTCIRELNDELMRTYHSRDFKTDDLDDTHTRLQHAQDELTTAQSYVHHLETELHYWDKQLEVSQAQVADLQHKVEHLQELIPPEPEEDPEVRLPGIMHVEVDLLDDVGDVRMGERQVLEGPSKAPEVNQISNRRPGLGRDLGMCVHQCRNQIAVHPASSLKNIDNKLTLSEEGPIRLMLYGDSRKWWRGPGSFMANSRLRAYMVCYRSVVLNAVKIMSSM
jgi:hypothetical protein